MAAEVRCVVNLAMADHIPASGVLAASEIETRISGGGTPRAIFSGFPVWNQCQGKTFRPALFCQLKVAVKAGFPDHGLSLP